MTGRSPSVSTPRTRSNPLQTIKIIIKKYLREIELAGIILLFIGFVLGHLMSLQLGAMIVVVGLLLWLFTVIFKALNWKQYQRENIVNIYVMSGAIIIFLITLFLRK